jgi:proton-translocating NADH-quinone oxidoreductase chain L
MYLLIVCLPLIGFLFAAFFGRFLGSKGAALITAGCVGFAACLSCIAFYEVGLCGSQCYIHCSPWFYSELLDVSWGCLFDSLTLVMCVVVTCISTLVHVYSIAYMEKDPHLPRFMSYLSVFTFFMLMLVTANNWIHMFFGWEGVGLSSYLLINFWFTRSQANTSAIKAMLVNRVGDFGLALGIMAIFAVFQTVDFITVFSCAHHAKDCYFIFFTFELHALTTICLLLFVGAVGKSAQLGLHMWLPDAMEGPTPVSALIHAATMVTAGIFMIVRCSPLFEHSETALMVITIIGSMTAFFAASTGLMQNDLKRVIAYSTCSQLGYMIFVCGLSQYTVGIFHVMNHAFFKALLFLGAGSVIHALSDEQDMRKMGSMLKLLPFTYSMMVIGSLALIGFPFLSGFYSKDVILEMAYARYSIEGHFAYWLGIMSALCTAYYSFRLLLMTFVNPINAIQTSLKNVHDAPLCMAIPLMILACGSLFVGYASKDMLIGPGTPFWHNSVYSDGAHSLFIESEYIPQVVKGIPVICSVLGALLALCLTHASYSNVYLLKTSYLGKKIYTFFNKRWLFDTTINDKIARTFLTFGHEVSFKSLDKGFIEALGPSGLTHVCIELANNVRSIQSGYIYQYALLMLVNLTCITSLWLFWDVLSACIDSRLYVILFLALLFMQHKRS